MRTEEDENRLKNIWSTDLPSSGISMLLSDTVLCSFVCSINFIWCILIQFNSLCIFIHFQISIMFFHLNFMLIFLYSVILKKIPADENVTMTTFFSLESLSWPSAPCLIKQENVFYTLSVREKNQNETDYVICTPDRKCHTVFARFSEATTDFRRNVVCELHSQYWVFPRWFRFTLLIQ